MKPLLYFPSTNTADIIYVYDTRDKNDTAIEFGTTKALKFNDTPVKGSNNVSLIVIHYK